LSSGWTEAGDNRHSGIIIALDRKAGVLVLSEIGPWRRSQKTAAIGKRIALILETECVGVARVSGRGPTAWWLGEWVSAPVSPWAIKPGDFVTVEVERDRGRVVALKVMIPQIGGPSARVAV
jgi:hypothetical protein